VSAEESAEESPGAGAVATITSGTGCGWIESAGDWSPAETESASAPASAGVALAESDAAGASPAPSVEDAGVSTAGAVAVSPGCA